MLESSGINKDDLNCGNTHFKCRYNYRICHSRVKVNSTNWAAPNIRVFIANLTEDCRPKAACKRTQQLPVAPTMYGVVACVLVVVCQGMQQLPKMLGPAVHRGKDTTDKSL